MRNPRLIPRRYQLKKEAVQVLLTGHPWIFRSHLSSAAEVFPDGQWLQLVDHKNEIQGYGIFEKDGLIGIRMLKLGKNPPDDTFFEKKISTALAKREKLRSYTNAFRALHGENDGIPGVVIDVYGDTGVLQTYSTTVDALGRYIAAKVCRELGLKNLVWKLPVRRKRAAKEGHTRVLKGHLPGTTKFREGKLNLTVEIGQGQKSGTFLDLRGLRKWIASQPLKNFKVLNLFSYSGTLGLAAEVAGATEIWNVDVSKGALEHGNKYHALNKKHFKLIDADIFEWLPNLPREEKFDLIIVDPPSMASQSVQVTKALRAYHQIYRAVIPHLSERGILVASCCTSRIARKRFRMEIDKAIGGRLTFKRALAPEDDHPVGFPEGDYLKMLIYG